jgi:pimeloyl-ACP methyl ester carboxylesterase
VPISPEQVLRAEGPWRHRNLSANGSLFHVVEQGEGPLVILLHGFPQFWWTWRHLIPELADQGFRVVAVDLRGYGASDHPPHGYDPTTLSDDIAAIIRSLGEDRATVIGHGWGGIVAWTLGVTHPELTDGVVAVNAPHPRRMRHAMVTDSGQRSAMSFIWGLQLPFWPERTLRSSGAARIEHFLRTWSADDTWLDSDTLERYRTAFLRWPTAHTAIESYRWAVRSVYRTDGVTYMSRMESPLTTDVLVVTGSRNPLVCAETFQGCADYVTGSFTQHDLPAGHFVHEEVPGAFRHVVVEWLTTR